MALRTKWTIRVDDLQTSLAVDDRPDVSSPVLVSLMIEGLAPASPNGLHDCLDYAPICDWITYDWPKRSGTPLMETRVNELLCFLFAYDKRVQNAWVGMYRPGSTQRAGRIGIERKASRSQFQMRPRTSSL